MKKILVTGINGFVGSHLADFLLKNTETEMAGIFRWRSNKENLKRSLKYCHILDADLLDLGSLIRKIGEYKPDIIFHLAAQSYVVSSYNYPAQTINTNIMGTLNLLESIRILKLDPVIHICGSSEVYGMVKKEHVPIKEDCPFNPSSPYAVGKIGEDMVSLQYYNSYGIKTIRTRAFSHTGPRRGEVFAASAFAKQLAAIKLKLKKVHLHLYSQNNLIHCYKFENVWSWLETNLLVFQPIKMEKLHASFLAIFLSCQKPCYLLKFHPRNILLFSFYHQPCHVFPTTSSIKIIFFESGFLHIILIWFYIF